MAIRAMCLGLSSPVCLKTEYPESENLGVLDHAGKEPRVWEIWSWEDVIGVFRRGRLDLEFGSEDARVTQIATAKDAFVKQLATVLQRLPGLKSAEHKVRLLEYLIFGEGVELALLETNYGIGDGSGCVLDTNNYMVVYQGPEANFPGEQSWSTAVERVIVLADGDDDSVRTLITGVSQNVVT